MAGESGQYTAVRRDKAETMLEYVRQTKETINATLEVVVQMGTDVRENPEFAPMMVRNRKMLEDCEEYLEFVLGQHPLNLELESNDEDA